MALNFGGTLLSGKEEFLSTESPFWSSTGIAFVKSLKEMNVYYNRGVVIVEDDTYQISLNCPVTLPDGVTITELILNGERTEGLAAVYYLYRKPIGGDDTTSEEIGSGVIELNNSITFSEKNQVDNDKYVYYIFVGGNVGVHIKIYDVRINYTTEWNTQKKTK